MTRKEGLDARLDAMVYRLPVPDAARLLADVDADDLAAVALDANAPWYRRRLAVAGLHRRLPAGHAERLYAVLVLETETIDLQEALAEVVAGDPGPVAERLLDWLRRRTCFSGKHLPAVYLLRARATLGDTTVVRALVRVAAEEHWTYRDRANAVLDDLGRATVLAELGASSPDELIDPARYPEDDDIRLTGVRMLRLTASDPAPALADPSRIVARAAYEALAERDHVPGGRVDRMAAEPGPGRLWALAVLHAQGRDITSLPIAIAASRVELRAVPDDVRAAIVHHWAPGRRLTDPRWLVEAALARPAVIDVDGRLRRAVAALDAAGLQPGEPVAVDELCDQGDVGTYHQIATAAGPVDVSTLGPFYRARDIRAAVALHDAGLRRIDGALARTVVSGLCVYFFGSTDPLAVEDLLFYWQD